MFTLCPLLRAGNIACAITAWLTVTRVRSQCLYIDCDGRARDVSAISGHRKHRSDSGKVSVESYCSICACIAEGLNPRLDQIEGWEIRIHLFEPGLT